MKDGFVKSSTHFFKLIKRSALLFIALLLVLAFFVPAPLQAPANPALTPNPVRSAWFLLWIQEAVSWSRLMSWPVIFLGALFFLLPWLPGSRHIHRAVWFPKEQRVISLFTVSVFIMVLILTVVAMFLRGPNWAFGWQS
ncbi:MAG TPA: selenite/tellurite reduction operon b-type cytochrome membrane protein ExtQ [Desulfuromonadaceae bacterium]|jgi:hypothetical protein